MPWRRANGVRDDGDLSEGLLMPGLAGELVRREVVGAEYFIRACPRGLSSA